MKASELRIGNLVLKHNGEITKVSGQFIADFEKYGNETLMTIPPRPFYTGIPLTSEWLEKFGFESEDDGQNRPRYIIGDLMGLNYSFGAWYWRFNDLQDKSHVELRYVHQLQNLYFALTGEELTIKDDGKKEGKEEKADREVDRRNMGS